MISYIKSRPWNEIEQYYVELNNKGWEREKSKIRKP